MKRPTQIIVLVACIVLIIGAACWYWLFSQALDAPHDAPFATNVLQLATAPTDTDGSFPPPIEAPVARRVEEVVGIGAMLKKDQATGALMIAGTVPNSPAAAAGLSGDFLVRKIDDVLTDGMKLQECVNLIRGPVGSKVRLELFDIEANEIRTVELTREKVRL